MFDLHFDSILILVCCYFIGSVPSAFLVTKLRVNKNLFKVGSGTLGSANVMRHTGFPFGIFVGVYDLAAKGILPVLIMHSIDLEIMVQGMGILMLLVGHNWSVFTKFRGGRGVMVATGALIGLGMWGEIILLGIGFGLVGSLFYRDMGFWTFVSMIMLPVICYGSGRSIEMISLAGMIVVLLIVKRLMANSRIDRNESVKLVFLRRLVWDRDILSRKDWVEGTRG